MKIFHISALPVWSMDGKGGMPSLRKTLTGHCASGHQIELLLPKYDPFSDDLKTLDLPQKQNFKIHFARCCWLPFFKKLRIKAKRFSNDDSVPYVLRWLLNVFMLSALTVSLVKQSVKVNRKGFQPQLIYAHNQYAALAGYIVSRLLKTPNVTRLYGTFLADLMKRPLVSFRYPTAAAGYLIPSDLLICTNDGTRGDEVAERFGIPAKRFRFWQNGVEPPTSRPKITRQEFSTKFSKLRTNSKWIISCSRLSYWKRIDRMLEALTICKKEGMDCQLIIAGDGPEKEKLHRIAKKLDVEGSVVWLGAVAHDDIWGLMNLSDIFMITNDVTNRCNPLYESAWAGLPIISVKDQSTSDLLIHGKNALLAEKEDTAALGQYLCKVCKNVQLRKKMKDSQKRLSESFWTWEERMKIEVKELEKLVQVKRKRNDPH